MSHIKYMTGMEGVLIDVMITEKNRDIMFLLEFTKNYNEITGEYELSELEWIDSKDIEEKF